METPFPKRFMAHHKSGVRASCIMLVRGPFLVDNFVAEPLNLYHGVGYGAALVLVGTLLLQPHIFKSVEYLDLHFSFKG